ncbi:hypothetical protein [Kibdelosporangium aridum]|uniref:BRO-N domain-containing protein n=1 Tax=Kibdelosporangium aridum TaxID=2030 RepID=UPI000A64A04E|nr:hypothetical protein [Kibdelosporangium aridum]
MGENELDLFAGAADGLLPEHFGLTEDGTAFVYALPFARAWGHQDANKVIRLLDEDEWSRHIVASDGTVITDQVILEDGIWELIMVSRKPAAKAIKKRVKAILRQLRETGRVDVRPLGDPLDQLEAETQRTVRAIAVARQERARAEIAEARANKADERVEAITGGTGHTPSDWREMFLLTPQGEFFEHLYAHGYLIDQRNTRTVQKNGVEVVKDGPDHGKPRAPKGDLYFKQVPTGTYGGKARSQTVVRPNMHEALCDRLVSEGLIANPSRPRQIGGAA